MWKCLFLEKKKWGKDGGFRPLLLLLANLIRTILSFTWYEYMTNKNYKNKQINA